MKSDFIAVSSAEARTARTVRTRATTTTQAASPANTCVRRVVEATVDRSGSRAALTRAVQCRTASRGRGSNGQERGIEEDQRERPAPTGTGGGGLAHVRDRRPRSSRISRLRPAPWPAIFFTCRRMSPKSARATQSRFTVKPTRPENSVSVPAVDLVNHQLVARTANLLLEREDGPVGPARRRASAISPSAGPGFFRSVTGYGSSARAEVSHAGWRSERLKK